MIDWFCWIWEVGVGGVCVVGGWGGDSCFWKFGGSGLYSLLVFGVFWVGVFSWVCFWGFLRIVRCLYSEYIEFCFLLGIGY